MRIKKSLTALMLVVTMLVSLVAVDVVLAAEEQTFSPGQIAGTEQTGEEENAPRLVQFVMRHAGQTIDITETDEDYHMLVFEEDEPFEFEVKVEDADNITGVYIVSERNDEIKRMQADYDPDRNLWVAEGFFDPGDTSYAPGLLSVEFAEDISHLLDDIIIDFNEDVDFEEFREFLAPEWQNASITEDGNAITIVLDNDEQTEFLLEIETGDEPEAILIDDLIAQGFEQVTDANGITTFIRLTGDMLTEEGAVLEIFTPTQVQSRALITVGVFTIVKVVAKTAVPAAFGWKGKTLAASTAIRGIGYTISATSAIINNRRFHNANDSSIESYLGLFSSYVTLSQIFFSLAGYGELYGFMGAFAGLGLELVLRLNMRHYLISSGIGDDQIIIVDSDGYFIDRFGAVHPIFRVSFDWQNGAVTINGFHENVDSASRIARLTIPSSIVGFPVNMIGANAFRDNTVLTSVHIPDSVTGIGTGAFRGNISLTDVTIGNSVTGIGPDAFRYNTSLTSIVIPNSVTSIASNAFRGNTALSNVTIGSGVTNIGSGAFNSVPFENLNINMRYVNASDLVGNTSGHLTGIPTLRSLTFGNNVHTISGFTGNTSLTNLTIGNSVTAIAGLSNNTALESIVIPDSVTAISGLSGNTSLTNLTIGNGVISIDSDSFSDNTALTDIIIPDSVTTIDRDSFSGNTSLTNLVIPDSVTSIGSRAFSNNTSLTSIVIPDSVTLIEWAAFGGNTSLTNLVIPDSVTTIEGGAFGSNTSLTSVDIPNSVTSIGPNAFSGNTSLTSVVIPDSVTIIERSVFSGNTSMTSVVIPNSVTQIHRDAFVISGLTSVVIPDSVTLIEDGAFASNMSLTDVTIGSGVTSIARGAFAGAPIENLTLNIRYILNNIFNHIPELRTLTLGDNVTLIDATAFGGSTSLTDVFISDSVTEIGAFAFADNTSLTNLTIGNSVRQIHDGAFRNTGITSVVIPASVTEVGWDVFSDNASLRSVTFMNATPLYDYYDYYIFYNTPSLTTIYVPRGSYAAYRAVPQFSQFNIIEICLDRCGVCEICIANPPTPSPSPSPTPSPTPSPSPSPSPSPVPSPDPTITIRPASALPNGRTAVTVDILNNPGFEKLDLTISYDHNALTLLNTEPGPLFDSSFIRPESSIAAASPGALTVASPSAIAVTTPGAITLSAAGEIHLAWENTGSQPEDGTLVTLFFEVEDITPGETGAFTLIEIESIDGLPIEPANIDQGFVFVYYFLLGDVTGEGRLSMVDITRLARYLANHPVTLSSYIAADVDGSGGSPTTNDIVRLGRYIMRHWGVYLTPDTHSHGPVTQSQSTAPTPT